ncbi:TPR-REGION domain-containing protein [Mycena indigotica]|uniref:TPR-REGION domain-containing protein n=1 Tax=Mycena indigotica TaxID=2126181 RepID=A0A8H6SY13_9AGAR|nr:TPR-REGION domain-containing protein [Mycena indigotica]KAF7306417.1 TPR-REGION domain-containing protein [Mycena indigotica]
MSGRHVHQNGPVVSPTVPTNGTSVTSSAVTNGASSSSVPPSILKLTATNEQTWLLIGRVAEQMGDLDTALSAYENALRHNSMSLPGLTQVAGIARIKENYPKARCRVLPTRAWAAGGQRRSMECVGRLGHCYLMQDDLQKAYSAYQQALYLLPNPKARPEDPKLWYGIGILYDRYGSLDHAEEAFSSVLRMDKDLDFDKANEILFRLGIIYKQQGKYDDSLNCFDRILRNPPNPLAHADIWFQIGHVYEQQKDYVSAKDAYERVVADNPGHAKVLQQLGWLYHQDGSSFQNQDLAIQYLTKSLEADPSDAQSWYLLGRAYMAGQKYNKAYEAYQQAVYRDGRNPTFWCSIGVLYFQINQYRDALDAYSRAIRINPYISEVWFDLGSLYESCNNQISDAMDAYARASELDPSNTVISARLNLLRNAQANGTTIPAAPGPQDVHPTAYASAVVPPPGLGGPPLLLSSSGANGQRPVFRADSRGPPAEIALPPAGHNHHGRGSPSGPFRGGPPPPVILDETRHPQTQTLAPMDVDGPRRDRERERGLLLHHPVPQPQASLPPPEDGPAPSSGRNGHHHPHPNHSHGHIQTHNDSYFTSSTSRHRPHSTTFVNAYPTGGRGGPPPAHRSPRPFPGEPEMAWDRRGSAADYDRERERERDRDREREREMDRDRRPRHSAGGADYPGAPPFYPGRSESVSGHHRERERERDRVKEMASRGRSPDTSPRSGHPARYWETPSTSSKPSGPGLPPMQHAPENSMGPVSGGSRRYDPRYDGREMHHRDSYEDRGRERERSTSRGGYPGSHAGSPEGLRHPARPPPPAHVLAPGSSRSESPMPMGGNGDLKRRRSGKEESAAALMASSDKRNDRKRRSGRSGRKEDGADTPTPMPMPTPKPSFNAVGGPGVPGPSTGAYKMSPGYKSPGPVSSNGSGSSGRSVQPSPTNPVSRMPARVVDDDYDEPGVADALMGLSSYREMPAPSSEQSPTVSSGSRHSDRDRPIPSHRDSVSSTRSRNSPPGASLKRPLSATDDVDMESSKRSRVDVLHHHRRSSSSGGGARRTPVPSTRPSPIPFRTQAAAAHDEARDRDGQYPASPPLPAVFPPHPRPVGMVQAPAPMPISLPPIATLSPSSTAPSPQLHHAEEKMQVDVTSPRQRPSQSPPGSARKGERSPPKHTPSPSSEP